MRLSDFQQRSRGTQAPQFDPQTNEPLGSIRAGVAYRQPISAKYNGQPVTLLATADIVGMSPAEKFVDENGRLDWASSDDFVVNDRHVLPIADEQTQRIETNQRNLTGSGQNRIR